MVTEFGPQIPVQVAAKYDDTRGAEALLRPLISAWVRRGRHQTPRPCNKSAAPAGCVQRNIDLSELRQIG
jgi:hypothetical protein